MNLPPPLKPIPMKERSTMVFVEKCLIDVRDGAFVLIDKNGIRKQIPVAGLACLMLEPGVRISHMAVHLAATVGTLLVWVGEAGVRLYASGQPGGARSDRLLYQAKLALDEKLRLKVVRKMFEMRFGEPPPANRSVDQLKGIEGARVRKSYELMAKQYGVKWKGTPLRSERLGGRGSGEPSDQRRNILPVRTDRSRDFGGRVRTGDRVHSYR